MKKFLMLGVATVLFASCKKEDPTAMEGYTLVWSDEFNSSTINSSNWKYELGDGTAYGLPPGWGNNELQIYTDAPANSYIETDDDGVSALVISAQEDSPGNYTSAKLTTQGLQSFMYGRIEARMKMPFGEGMWPAFWMLGDNITEVDWPGCGEIDIMEMVGFEPNIVHGTVHYTTSDNFHNSYSGSQEIQSGNLSDLYHNYRIEWTPTEMIFSLDEVPYHTVEISSDMKEFKRSFYMILNIAVGGSWPGPPNASTSFPQKMFVDYIRVYSKNGFTAPLPPVLDVDEETLGEIVPVDVAQHAFNDSLDQFPGILLKSYGGGGAPVISSSVVSIDGDSSLTFNYPGGNWGGGWFELDTPMDLTNYTNGHLSFSIKPISGQFAEVEVKLEAVSNTSSVFLSNYSPTSAGSGWVEYSIPISDFAGVDLNAIKIPFALWNPTDANGSYPFVNINVDNIYWN